MKIILNMKWQSLRVALEFTLLAYCQILLPIIFSVSHNFVFISY